MQGERQRSSGVMERGQGRGRHRGWRDGRGKKRKEESVSDFQVGEINWPIKR